MTLFFALLGLLLGIIAGILPGLGTTTLLAMLIVPLSNTDPINVIIFYICILTSAQYFGSVGGILTGVPGDPSAMPSAKWGFAEATNGRGSSLLFATAKWSLISGLISFLLFILIIKQDWYWAKSLTASAQALLFLAATCGIVLFSQNSIVKNLLLVISGAFLSLIGYSENFQDYFLSSPNSITATGIPWLSVMTGLLVIPGLWSLPSKPPRHQVDHVEPDQNGYIGAATRGGIIGFLLGMTPGLSYVLSSMAAAKLEETVSSNSRKIVVSAESANNAGAVSVLLPMFMLGIPITASESIIFMLLTSNATSQALPTIFQSHWIEIFVYFVSINIALFFLSWRYAATAISIIFAKPTVLVVISLLLAISGVIWFGVWSHTLGITLITLVISSIIGINIKKLDWSPLVYVMIICPYIESTVYKFQQLYF